MGERGTTERVLTLLGHEFEPLDATEVRTRIREMAALDPERARFGSRTHRYELRPALPEAEIGAFEEEHGIRLPPDYRAFVAEVGDGPAGPAHGLLPLATPRPEAEDGAVRGRDLVAGPGLGRSRPRVPRLPGLVRRLARLSCLD
ncbi:SMI1/KNR4 family protein [Streptomyces sp. NBC_00691]|uniref:SMI1/KNR4 family protein n=1 Tax=Streptomyces sp. NBC_00691 TaxID=2903671 RepID=UPI002E3719DA|nr:SMI1/KNR4 family protein [Streptomyces sp. NBC_00691]